jgi:glutaconate CoA-transferase subunit A
MGIYTSKNKTCSLSEAVSHINDGDIVAIGGNLSAREPIEIIHEVIRQGKRNLHTIGGAHGIDIDLMCAAGIVKTVQNSYVGFEADFGLAPNYRRMVELGIVTPKDTDCVAILTHLRGAVFGVPFMPMIPVRGTDILKLNPEIKTMTCPYTGEQVNVLPTIKPDCALIHAHKADRKGNIKLFPPYFADPLIVEASKKTIVSVEKIVSEEEMNEIGATLPYYEITAVVELPFGAHPTSCYPNYCYDRSHIAQYIKLARQGPDVFYSQYMKKYVFGPKSHHDYLEIIGGEQKQKELSRWNENNECWKELMLKGDRKH